MSGLTVILPQLSGSMFFDEGAKTIRDILRSVADDGGCGHSDLRGSW
jgi:hypothetical protein